jgi:hypothetical protein
LHTQYQLSRSHPSEARSLFPKQIPSDGKSDEKCANKFYYFQILHPISEMTNMPFLFQISAPDASNLNLEIIGDW